VCWLPTKIVPGVSQEHSATAGKVEVSTTRSDKLEKRSDGALGAAMQTSSMASSVANVRPSSRLSQ
jgi:hypothetical protein